MDLSDRHRIQNLSIPSAHGTNEEVRRNQAWSGFSSLFIRSHSSLYTQAHPVLLSSPAMPRQIIFHTIKYRCNRFLGQIHRRGNTPLSPVLHDDGYRLHLHIRFAQEHEPTITVASSPAVLAEEETPSMLVVCQSDDFHAVVVCRLVCLEGFLPAHCRHLPAFILQYCKTLSRQEAGL